MTQSTNLKNDFRELMLNILWLLFSFKGRITREVYWLGNILLAVGSVLIMRIYLHGSFFIDETMPNQIGDPQFLENIFNQILQNRPNVLVIAPIFAIVMIWSSLAIVAKRAHDQNLPGWVALLIFVPIQFFPLLVMIFFGIIKGDRNPNKYGKIANTRQ